MQTNCKRKRPMKDKLKKRSPWENQDICLKRKNLHEAAQLKNSCPYEENTESYNLAQKLLYDIYDTEQEIYLQSKIDEIRRAVSNNKSAMVGNQLMMLVEEKRAIR